jgi:hypothetical protein
MLGWQVFVNKESEADTAGQSMMSWHTGVSGLSWLDELVRQGLVEDLGGSGYPNKYSCTASILLPQIMPSMPSYDEKLVIGDDYVLDGTENQSIKINKSKIDTCKPSDQLIIEIWDMS